MMSALEHFRFAHPDWLLLMLPALLMLFLRKGRGSSAAVIFPNLSVLFSLGQRVRHAAGSLALPLTLLALFSAIFAMARPVWRKEYQNRTASGIDVMVALDLSLSMDIDDFIDQGERARRIDVAKNVVDDFITRRPDDRMGLIAFAGRPRVVSPITLDHKWLRNSLNALRLNDRENLGTIKDDGTAIGSALAAAASRLNARDAKSKIIVLVTDGASNSGKIAPLEAARQAKILGIKTYTIAIGTTEGRVDQDTMRFPYQEFDLPTLKEIAAITGAENYWARNLETFKSSFTSIDQLEKSDAKSYLVVENIELFPWLLGITLLCVLSSATLLALNPPPSP